MIIDIQGVKGGAGKSIIARFVVNHFLANNPFIIDTDTGNHDVARSYVDKATKQGKSCEVRAIDTTTLEGSGAMADAILDIVETGRPVIINRGARNQDEMAKFGSGIGPLCKENNIELITLWVSDTDATCAEQVLKYAKLMDGATKIAVIKNYMTDTMKDYHFEKLNTVNGFSDLPSTKFPFLPEIIVESFKSPTCCAVHELDTVLTRGTLFMVRNFINSAKDAIAEAIKIAR